MKIAYVYDAVFPWEAGGVQKRVWELSRRLAEDHDVHWYGMQYWDGPATIEREGVTIHGVMDSRELYVDGRRSIPEALSFAAHLARPLSRERFDVIDVQEFPYFPTFTSKLRSITGDATLVMTWHEIWDEYWHEYLGWKGTAGRAVERLCTVVPDVHFGVSESTCRDLEAMNVTCHSLVPNGIELESIDAAPASGDELTAVFVGRLIPEKNPCTVARALGILREEYGVEVSGCFVGDGPERERLVEVIAEEGLEDSVAVHDYLDEQPELFGLMKAADAFVLPSEREGFSITALEALACGTPVVTADHPRNNAASLVDEPHTGSITGLDPESVAEGIHRALTGSSPEACRRFASSYSWDEVAGEIEALYRKAADGGTFSANDRRLHGGSAAPGES